MLILQLAVTQALLGSADAVRRSRAPENRGPANPQIMTLIERPVFNQWWNARVQPPPEVEGPVEVDGRRDGRRPDRAVAGDQLPPSTPIPRRFHSRVLHWTEIH
ncbi:MAG TPA: hypothetical protein VGD43_07635 [Micromonospora sp.]